jgi:crossover junction endodeoxyribonuclease RuvC
MKANRTILGIDPGTGRLGWAILRIDGGVKKLLDYGCLETKANTPLPERLDYIYNGVSEIIAKYSPTEMAIEELFFVKNVKTGISVAHARGVVLLSAVQNKIPIFDYKPNEIKLAVCGHGHADKAQIARMLKLHLKGCMIKQDDAADAVAVALCHLQTNSKLI